MKALLTQRSNVGIQTITQSKPVILLVILFIVVGLTYSSYSISNVVFAKPKVSRGAASIGRGR
jgi:hypothetical protein